MCDDGGGGRLLAHVSSSAPPADPGCVRGDNCLSGINREINEFISGGEFSSSRQHLVL